MRRLFACFLAAILAWCVGKALHVPVWRDGWDIGDRTDLAVLAAYLVLMLAPRQALTKEDPL